MVNIQKNEGKKQHLTFSDTSNTQVSFINS